MKGGQADFVQDMFQQIAPRYDFLNRLLSLRQDVIWRRQMVRQLHLSAGSKVLDVACGTADVALEVARQYPKSLNLVVGVDFAPAMLTLARKKILRAGLSQKILLAAADAFKLPFASQTFDAITIAFGIRNIHDKQGVLIEFFRLLSPGGSLAILELVVPDKNWMQKIYLEYFNRILPRIGRLFSRHSFAYSYLPESVARFPSDHDFCGLMSGAGFRDIFCRRFTFGTVALFAGKKPQASRSET